MRLFLLINLSHFSLFPFGFSLFLLLLSSHYAQTTDQLENKEDNLFLIEEDAFLAFVKSLSKFDNFFKEMKEQTKKDLMSRVNGNQNFNLRDYLAQKYDARLSALHLMWQNWNCANVVEDVQGEDRTMCQTFRRHLDFVYEYLFRLYLEANDPTLSQQMPAVKPKFENGQLVEPVLNEIEQLVRISMFYFKEDFKRTENFHSEGISQMKSKPKLVNEEALIKVDQLIETHQKHWAGEETSRILAQIDEELKKDPYFADYKDEKFEISLQNKQSVEKIRNLFKTKLSLMLKMTKKNAEKEKAEMEKERQTEEEEDTDQQKAKRFQDKYFGYLNSPFLNDH